MPGAGALPVGISTSRRRALRRTIPHAFDGRTRASMAVRASMRTLRHQGSAAAASGSRGSCARRGCVPRGGAGASRARPTASMPTADRAQSVGTRFYRHGSQSQVGRRYHRHRDPGGVALPVGHCRCLFAPRHWLCHGYLGGMRRWSRPPWRWRSCSRRPPGRIWCTTPIAAANTRSRGYRGILESQGIVLSMSGKGEPYDNALMESFFATLKAECVERHNFQTHRAGAHLHLRVSGSLLQPAAPAFLTGLSLTDGLRALAGRYLTLRLLYEIGSMPGAV